MTDTSFLTFEVLVGVMAQLLIIIALDLAQVLVFLVVFTLFFQKSNVYSSSWSYKGFASAFALALAIRVFL